MKNVLFILTIIIFIISCRNYESKEYFDNENQAISDVILAMTEFDKMKRINEWSDIKLKLYVVAKLDTISAWIEKPKGYTIALNDVSLSKKRITENRKRYENELAEYEEEEFLFRNLKNGKLKPRVLNYNFQNEKLDIELIKSEKFKTNETIDNEFGYLFVSRVIFNINFTKGCLHYQFFCGEACAWDSNIEVTKINGVWKITKVFSGGIA